MSKHKSEQEESNVESATGGEAAEIEIHNLDDVAEGESPQRLDIEVDLEVLRAELEQLQTDVEEHKSRYLRAMAEVDNTRRRAETDVANARKFGVESFASEALSVRDSLELARAIEVSAEDSGVVEKIKEGLDLTLKQLDSVFAKFGVKSVEPQPGDKLNPEQHQAMSIQESTEIAPNHIVTVVQKGYSIHDRLLRPAMVIVAKAAQKNT